MGEHEENYEFALQSILEENNNVVVLGISSENLSNATPNLEINNLNNDESVLVRVHYTSPGNVRRLPRSCALSFMTMFLTMILLVDLVYNSYMRATLCEDIMRLVKHSHWNSESLFLIFQSSLGFGVLLFLTCNILTKTKMHDTIFISCLTTLGLVVITNATWIIREHRDRRKFYLLTNESSDLLNKIASASHMQIDVLVQLKVFESFLLIFMGLIWLRQWHEYNVDVTVTRRIRPLVQPQVRQLDASTSRTPHSVSVTIPIDSYSQEPPNPAEHHPMGGFDLGKSMHSTTANETDINKSAQEEFREKGDGNDITTAVPRILVTF